MSERLFELPATLKKLYDDVVDAGGTYECENQLDKGEEGFGENGNGKDGAHYCGAGSKTKPDYVYWMSDMSVDCDGTPESKISGGPCDVDGSYQPETAFEISGKPIDAMAVPYVVMNVDRESRANRFSATEFVKGKSAVAVVCGTKAKPKLTWAVFADTNPDRKMGEGSINLAQTCFGKSINGNSGHDEADVLYIAFPGADAIPSGEGTDFAKLKTTGDKLLEKHFEGSASESTSASASSSSTPSSASATKASSEASSSSSPASASASSTPAPSSPSLLPVADVGQLPQGLSTQTKTLVIVILALAACLCIWLAFFRERPARYRHVPQGSDGPSRRRGVDGREPPRRYDDSDDDAWPPDRDGYSDDYRDEEGEPDDGWERRRRSRPREEEWR